MKNRERRYYTRSVEKSGTGAGKKTGSNKNEFNEVDQIAFRFPLRSWLSTENRKARVGSHERSGHRMAVKIDFIELIHILIRSYLFPIRTHLLLISESPLAKKITSDIHISSRSRLFTAFRLGMRFAL